MRRYIYRTMEARAFFSLTRMREHNEGAYVADDSEARKLAKLHKDGFRLHDIADGQAIFSKVVTESNHNPFQEGPISK